MNDTNIYNAIWEKYRPVVISYMKLALENPQVYQLSKHEFEAIGGRLTSGYSFNLEVNNGILVNKISSIPVARDLLLVLKKSKTATELMQNNYYKINLTKDFRLNVKIIKQ